MRKTAYLDRIRNTSVYKPRRTLIKICFYLIMIILLGNTLVFGLDSLFGNSGEVGQVRGYYALGCLITTFGLKVIYDSVELLFDISDSMIDLNHRYDHPHDPVQ